MTIRDLLIVGLGDSTASGEGNPDHGVAFVRWQDRRCHRSAKGFEAQVAARLEAASPRTSVTFVPSPARRLDPHRDARSVCRDRTVGWDHAAAPGRRDEVADRHAPRRCGAGEHRDQRRRLRNIARFCFDDGLDAQDAAAIDCWDKPYPTASSPTTLRAWVRARRATLPDRYARLAAAFRAAGIPASKIYVTEYPNATRTSRGRRDPLIPYLDSTPFGYSVRGTITRAEAADAESELLLPVNAALKTAAAIYGWHLVSGIASQSSTHGVCSTRPWFVDVSESLIDQHDVLGTLHPNGQGQQAIAGLVVSALKP